MFYFLDFLCDVNSSLHNRNNVIVVFLSNFYFVFLFLKFHVKEPKRLGGHRESLL